MADAVDITKINKSKHKNHKKQKLVQRNHDPLHQLFVAKYYFYCFYLFLFLLILIFT